MQRIRIMQTDFTDISSRRMFWKYLLEWDGKFICTLVMEVNNPYHFMSQSEKSMYDEKATRRLLNEFEKMTINNEVDSGWFNSGVSMRVVFDDYVADDYCKQLKYQYKLKRIQEDFN